MEDALCSHAMRRSPPAVWVGPPDYASSAETPMEPSTW